MCWFAGGFVKQPKLSVSMANLSAHISNLECVFLVAQHFGTFVMRYLFNIILRFRRILFHAHIYIYITPSATVHLGARAACFWAPFGAAVYIVLHKIVIAYDGKCRFTHIYFEYILFLDVCFCVLLYEIYLDLILSIYFLGFYDKSESLQLTHSRHMITGKTIHFHCIYI